ncbi:MAG TPA: PAS domain-containing protein [Sulfurimonas sp.]|nr:PAS domain-containing protein [Sulfurimonas sp.]HIM75005.1 PAS domain-containing protein [Campylobacterales bacterium]
MLLKFINKKYRFELMESLTQTVKLGIVISNLIAPIIIVSILYGYISNTILLPWVCIHLGFLLIRMMINSKLIILVEKKDEGAHRYLKMMFSLGFLSAVLYGFIIWLSVLKAIPKTHILLIGIIIAGLSTGSLSTLGSIFTAYILYLIPNFFFLISALLYHGGDIFYLFSLAMFGMMGVFIISGYKHYKILRNAISLDTTFKSIYDNSADGLVVFRENNLISSNKAMVKLFNYESEAEFLSTELRKFSPMYQADGQPSIRTMYSMVRDALRDGYRSFEWLHVDKEHKEFWCEIVLTKIHLEGLDLLHGVWRDISHRKELELIRNKDKQKIESLNETLEERVNEALASNRAKDKQILHQSRLAQMGEMISMIAHQWRQPLSAIASASALINLKAELNKLDKETALEASQNIANYTQHLSATIDDFRDFFKQDKEQDTTNFTYLVKSVLVLFVLH